MGSAGTVGGAQVHHLLEALHARGLDPSLLCERTGLDPSTLLSPFTRVPWRTVLAVFAAADQISGDPLVGLHAAESVAIRGIIDYVAQAQPTVEQALVRLVRFGRIAISDLEAALESAEGRVTLRMTMGSGDLEGERHALEYFAALIVIQLAELSQGPIRPSQVRLPHAPAGPQEEYERVFRCPVRFRCPDLELVVAEDVLRVRLRLQSPEAAAALEEAARRQLAVATSASFRDQVCAALRASLAGLEHPAPRSIALRLGVSVRTLQRRLLEEATSFRAARDQVRRERALERMREPSVGVSQVAAELGFADVAAFSKAFKRWTGESPSARRRATKPLRQRSQTVPGANRQDSGASEPDGSPSRH
jgi:AraC-like DNA-binding protein